MERENAGGSLAGRGGRGDWLSGNLPGISGRFGVEREDFEVEEVLSYEPCGEGTHTFLWVEKRGLSTFECVKRLARALGRREREFGYAGLKDRNAVTRQWISIEHLDRRKLVGLEIPGLAILDQRQHRNKIKLGHLKGNRFRLLLRGLAEGDLGRARAILALLETKGVPNFFGLQRFGRGGSTPGLGRLLLEGRHEDFLEAMEPGNPVAGKALAEWKRSGKVERALRAFPRRFLSLCTAALQAQVFNDCLRARLGSLHEVEEGDIAFIHKNGACFLVEPAPVSPLDPPSPGDKQRPKGDTHAPSPVGEQRAKGDTHSRTPGGGDRPQTPSRGETPGMGDPHAQTPDQGDPQSPSTEMGDTHVISPDMEAIQARAARFEISPSGPLPGPKCLRPKGAPAALEAAILARYSLSHESFAASPGRYAPYHQQGARRPLRVPIGDTHVSPGPAPDQMLLSFSLPRGSYATAVLAELLRFPPDQGPHPRP